MMQDTMGPPNKRRRLLSSAQDFLQQSEAATRTPAPQFSHGIEHLQGPQASRTLKAKASPQHIEEVHLEIRNEPAADVGNGIRWFRRQGTAASTDALSTSSESGADVAVTAGAGILDVSATAAVSADLPDVSLASGSDSSTTSSDASVGPLSTGASSSTESDSSEPATSNTPTPTISSGAVSSQAATSSSGVPLSTGAASSSEESSQYGTGSSKVSLSTGGAASSQQSSQYGTGSSRVPSSTGTAASSSSSSSESSQGGTGSSRIPLSTGTAAQSSTASPSSATISDSSASSNGSVPVSSSSSTGSQGSGSTVAGTVSGYTASTLPASSSHRMNLTTSASVRTSGSVVFTSDYTIDLASATSSSGSRTTDSSSSLDLAALFLATLSGGEVETLTRSDESFTTTLSDGQTATISPSSSRGSSTQGSSSRQSGSVTTISNDRSTVRSTVFSTATPSSTQSSLDDSTNGVGIAGAAGEGATATSNWGPSSTPTPDDSGNSDDGPAPAGTIAGGVVGGAAGLALVLVMVLFFLRRYKKRSQIGHRALPPNSGGMTSEADPAVSSGGPGMAERAGLMPFAGAVPALFRHSNRNDNAGADTGERGFQRVSGRKLPSAFSEGMTGPPRNVMSPPPTMPLVGHEGSSDENAHGHAPYRDSVGFYGTTGSPTSPDPFSDNNAPSTGRVDGNPENLTMSPGPQRTPTIHAARPDVQNPSVATSGVPSWTPSSAAAFARSDTPASLDGSRNSRFTEEV